MERRGNNFFSYGVRSEECKATKQQREQNGIAPTHFLFSPSSEAARDFYFFEGEARGEGGRKIRF